MAASQAILSFAHTFRDAAMHGQWADAKASAVSLALAVPGASEAGEWDVSGSKDARTAEVLWVAASTARAGLVKVLAAFSARAARGPSRELALAAAASCTALLPEAWPPGAAEDLLGMSGIVALLLRAAALGVRSKPGLGGFATLRASRAAAELLAAVLEAAVPELRHSSEAALFRDASLSSPMQALAVALLSGTPDPRLHEALLEILWRGLRRVAAGAALTSLASVHPALICLEERQVGLSARLQGLSSEQLLADARGFALELAEVQPPAFAYRVVSEGWDDGRPGTAVMSSFCLGLHPENGELEPALELPWESLQLVDLCPAPEAEVSFGNSSGEVVLLIMSVDVEQMMQLGCLSEEQAVPDKLEILLDGILQDVHDTLTHCMDFGRMNMVPSRTQAPAAEESRPRLLFEDPIFVQESPKLVKRAAKSRPAPAPKEPRCGQKGKDKGMSSIRKPLSEANVGPPPAPIAEAKAFPEAPQPKQRQAAPRDSVQRVLEEAARLAREVAEVQRQFKQSKLATDARSNEATALLDDIEKAGRGGKRTRLD